MTKQLIKKKYDRQQTTTTGTTDLGQACKECGMNKLVCKCSNLPYPVTMMEVQMSEWQNFANGVFCSSIKKYSFQAC